MCWFSINLLGEWTSLWPELELNEKGFIIVVFICSVVFQVLMLNLPLSYWFLFLTTLLLGYISCILKRLEGLFSSVWDNLIANNRLHIKSLWLILLNFTQSHKWFFPHQNKYGNREEWDMFVIWMNELSVESSGKEWCRGKWTKMRF